MNFGLICEGDTDYPVILNLLAGHFNDRNVELNRVQPKQGESGGWTRILGFCESDRLLKSLDFNNYLIIQIDTDRRMDKGFDIHKYENTLDLIDKVKEKIIHHISIPLYETIADKIIFAICVHSIECWLLPFYANTAKDQSKENNCLKVVNEVMSKKGKGLNKKQTNTYWSAAKSLSNHKDFHKKKNLQESLSVFSKELDKKFNINNGVNAV